MKVQGVLSGGRSQLVHKDSLHSKLASVVFYMVHPSTLSQTLAHFYLHHHKLTIQKLHTQFCQVSTIEDVWARD